MSSYYGRAPAAGRLREQAKMHETIAAMHLLSALRCRTVGRTRTAEEYEDDALTRLADARDTQATANDLLEFHARDLL